MEGRMITTATLLCLFGFAVIALLVNAIIQTNAVRSKDNIERIITGLWTLKEDVDPCNDFYEYVCGNWNPNGSIHDETIDMLISILRDEDANTFGVPEMKVKTFFKSCTKMVFNTRDAWQNMIDDLGGWSFTKRSNPTKKTLPLTEVITTLQSEYFIDTFFKMKVIEENNERLLQMKQNIQLTKNDMNTLKDFLGFMDYDNNLSNETFDYSAIDYGNDTIYYNTIDDDNDIIDYATMDDDEPLNYEDMLYSDSNDYNALSNENIEKMDETYKFINIRRLKITKTMKNFKKHSSLNQIHLSSHYPKVANWSKMIKNAKVSAKEEYIKEIDQLISRQEDSQKIQDYLIWRLISETFQSGSLEIVAKFCLAQTLKYFSPVLIALYMNRSDEEYGDKVSEVKNVANIIQSKFLNQLDSMSWMTSQDIQIAKAKLKSTQFLIGYPDIIMDKVWLNKYYEEVTISDSYVDNLKEVGSFAFRKKMGDLNPEVNIGSWPWNNFESLSKLSNPAYIISRNVVEFPLNLLKRPYFWPNSKAMTFGSMGQLFGHELTHALDLGKMKVTTKVEECLKMQPSQSTKINHAEELLGDMIGLKLTEMNLDSIVQMEKTLDSIRSIESPTTEKYFYISIASSFCNSKPNQPKGNHPSPRERVNIPMFNSDMFGKVWNCKTRNSSITEKCSIW